MTNQIQIVLIASGSAVNEATYATFKASLDSALATFNTNHLNFQVVRDPNQSTLSEVG